MRLLITGASGLLGLNLALEAARAGHTVVGVANRHALRRETAFLSDACKFLAVDLLTPGAVEQVLDAAQPDWVIHCAALANLEECEADPDLADRMNTRLPSELAERCAQRTVVARGGARAEPVRLVHISTDAVFDGQKGNYTESDAPNPLSVYAHTKLTGEQAVAEANPAAIIARVNLFGWSLTGKRSLAEFFFNNLSVHKPVKGFTDVFFCPLLVNDLAQVFSQMLEKKLSGLYHVVSRESLSKYDFGVAVARRFGLDETLISPASVADGGLKAARSPNLTLSTAKLADALGNPPPSWREGLDRFYELYQQGYRDQLAKLRELREESREK